jgi:hypothetical protein
MEGQADRPESSYQTSECGVTLIGSSSCEGKQEAKAIGGDHMCMTLQR